MSHRQNLYVLTIPLTAGSLPGCRTLAQILLRRRSEGPVIIRDESRGPRTTDAMCMQAIFADQAALDAVKSDLLRALPYIPLQASLQRRRFRDGGEPACSCVQRDLPFYLQQETCLRHCSLIEGSIPPEPGTHKAEVSAILCETTTPGWAARAPLRGPCAPSSPVEQRLRTHRTAPFSRTRASGYQPAAHG